MLIRSLLFLTFVGVLVGVLWRSQNAQTPYVVSGFIEADEIRVGSRVGGRVVRVNAIEGKAVQRGELLVELDGFDLQARLAETAAKLKQTEARLALLRAGARAEEIAQAKALVDQRQAILEQLQHGPRQQEIEAATAELELARSERELAQKTFERAESLVQQGATSREDFDRSATEVRVAQSQVAVKQEALALLQEGTRKEEIEQAKSSLEAAVQAWKLTQAGSRAEEIAEAEATVEAAGAAKQAIEAQLDELNIVSPDDLVVEAVDLQPGDMVASNAPVLTLIDYRSLWVRAYVPENRLDLRLNDHVPITVDSFPGEKFEGVITFVANQAEFTPRNVQTPEERSKQVFRMKVTVNDAQRRLRPGMSADVWLDEVSDE